MSKRFGRNQKRQAQAEIARLRQELDLAITGGFARATGKGTSLDLLIGVPIAIDITDSEDGFTIQRTAKIRFIPSDRKEVKGFAYHCAYSGVFEWRGIVWIASMPHRADPAMSFYDQTIIELELRAIGERGGPERRAAAQPYMPIHDIKRHRRIAA